MFAVGCSRQPHPTLHELEKIPAASVVYPGGVASGQGGSDSNRKFGANAAIFQRTGVTNDAPGQLLVYFQTHLIAEGWIRNDALANTREDFGQTWGWTMGERRFTLGIVTAYYQRLRAQTTPIFAGYRTMYEVVIT